MSNPMLKGPEPRQTWCSKQIWCCVLYRNFLISETDPEPDLLTNKQSGPMKEWSHRIMVPQIIGSYAFLLSIYIHLFTMLIQIHLDQVRANNKQTWSNLGPGSGPQNLKDLSNANLTNAAWWGPQRWPCIWFLLTFEHGETWTAAKQ